MNGKELREAIRAGSHVFGSLIMSTSPRWPQRMKRLNLDFVFLDTEHVAIDREKLSWMCQLYNALNMASLVRITAPDPYEATCVLDGGACGIIVPYVESAKQVRQMAGAVKYRPLKGKKLADILSGERQCDSELKRYLDQFNEHNSLIVQIESPEGINALDEILDVPGLDAILIGPHDLSISLDIPEQYKHERFESTVRHIIRKVRAANIGVGIQFASGVEQEIGWGLEGLNMFSHKADIIGFIEKVGEDLELIKQGLAEKIARPV